MKKVCLNPEDFAKVVSYINKLPLQFSNAAQAVEVGKIIESAVLMEIEIDKPENISPEKQPI
jgi:hypothetical protein